MPKYGFIGDILYIVFLILMKKYITLIMLSFLISSCDHDVYETFSKEGEFTVRKVKKGGNISQRGFYVKGFKTKVRYRHIRNGKYNVGDKVNLSYDSIVNRTQGTYELRLPRRLRD